jgi:hypothetical protein
MNETNLLLGCSAALLIAILLSFRTNKVFASVNLICAILYSAILYYGLFFDVHQGTALAYWFYLLTLTSLHFILMIAYQGRRWYKSKKK